jgi:hypothetical protein
VARLLKYGNNQLRDHPNEMFLVISAKVTEHGIIANGYITGGQ